MEQVAVLEYQQQEELEDFIYRAAFLLADVGFFQEPAYTKLPDGISKPALNFRVVISVSMVYHKIGTFLRYFFDFANLIIPENRCFLLSMYKYICIQSQKFKGFQLVWSVGSLSDLVQIIDMFGGIAFSLIYLFTASGLLLSFSAIAISILVYIFTKKYHKKIASNNIKLQDHDETREEVISSRNKQRFKGFTRTILNLRVSSSDLDAKAYLWTDVLQSGFLIFAIVLTIYMGNYTSGQLFSIITYIMILNGHVCEINEVRVKIYDLIDSVARLERNEE